VARNGPDAALPRGPGEVWPAVRLTCAVGVIVRPASGDRTWEGRRGGRSYGARWVERSGGMAAPTATSWPGSRARRRPGPATPSPRTRVDPSFSTDRVESIN